MRRFGFPGWALLSATNLANWSPPPGVLTVLIAADRGEVGENAAWRLMRRLEILGVETTIRLPPSNAGDWNDALVADKRRMKQGDALRREGGERPRPVSGRSCRIGLYRVVVRRSSARASWRAWQHDLWPAVRPLAVDIRRKRDASNS